MRKLITLGGIILECFLFTQCKNKENFNVSTIKGNGVITKETRQVKNYENISIKGSIGVVLTNQEQDKILVKAEQNIISFVKTEVSGNTLEIKLENQSEKIKSFSISNKKDIIVFVPIKNINLKNLELIGSGSIQNETPLKLNSLNLLLRGSGNIKLNDLATRKTEVSLNGSGSINLWGKSNELIAKISGSGKFSTHDFLTENTVVNLNGSGSIRLEGNSPKLVANISGSGSLSAYDFSTTIANVNLRGSGWAKIYTSKIFSGIVKGSGNIQVKGTPSQVSKDINGSGSIQIL